jgi:DNA-binding NarL/FixJ family response regulator
MSVLRILLVDDHILMREGLAELLNKQPDMEVVGEAGDAAEALRLAVALEPELVLMDVGLTGASGIDAARGILATRPDANIVFLTMHDEDDLLFAGIRSGAKGYLLKSLPSARLLAYLRGIRDGEAAITPQMASRILAEFARGAPQSAPAVEAPVELTGREIEVLHELAMGADNRQIAELFVLSEGTVKNHVSSILGKLHLRNRREAAAYAQRHGI